MSGVIVPASIYRLLGAGLGLPVVDRAAWPVEVESSCRAVARSKNQALMRPSSTIRVLQVFKPSASNGLDLRPLGR